MNITEETSPANDLQWGHRTVGTVALALCNKFKTRRGVLIRANDSNTVPVYIGGQGVTPNTGVKGGVPLPAGMHIVIPVDDPSQLYVVATSNGQDVAWMGV